MFAKRCTVLISRSSASGITDKYPKEIFEHEIPVLVRIFGKGNVEKFDAPRMVWDPNLKENVQAGVIKYPIVEIDHDTEYARLEAVYGRDHDKPEPVVEVIYGLPEGAIMEQKNHMKYKPLIEKGHTLIPFKEIKPSDIPEDTTISFDDPEDAPEMEQPALDGESDLVGSGEQEAQDFKRVVDVSDLPSDPMNMGVDQVTAELESNDVPFDPDLPLDELRLLLMEHQESGGAIAGTEGA